VGSGVHTYRSGRHSKYLPVRMAAKYQEAQDDPELLSLRDEISLVDSRLLDLLARVDSGESGALWRALRKAHRAFKGYQRDKDVGKMHAAFAEMEACLDAGVTDQQLWQEIGEQVELRRKLAESESKRMVALHQVITAEQAMMLVGALTGIITRYVTDKVVLTAITVDLQQLLAREAIRGAFDETEA
jgi:23S rRNA-/tRNA-specific pseudouridylate synthase